MKTKKYNQVVEIIDKRISRLKAYIKLAVAMKKTEQAKIEAGKKGRPEYFHWRINRAQKLWGILYYRRRAEIVKLRESAKMKGGRP